jgi:hypothetical protein
MEKPMTLKELIIKAVKTDNARLAGKAADVMRFRGGMTYTESYELVHKLTGIDLRRWEALLYEADA